MIDLDHVTFRYEDMLMDFTLHAAASSFTSVIGPSGGGKSTLLSLIAGFEQPQSGTIRLAGTDMANIPPSRRPVHMIFQDHNVFMHLDCWRNVALGIKPSLRLTAAERSEVDAALEQTGIAHLARRRPDEMSGGERQRVAIARALLRRKPVLLLDEPFAALGPALRRDMLDLLARIKADQNLTVIMVTHQPEDAAYAGGDIAFVSGGRILAHRPAANLLAASGVPEIAAYLGDTTSMARSKN